MRITTEELYELVVDTVGRYAGGGMERRRIIDRVEQRLRKRGAWEDSDDAWSESTDPKSLGRAKIDWAISDLKRTGCLENVARNRWVSPARQPDRKERGTRLLFAATHWAATRPDVLNTAQAIADDEARVEFLVAQYLAWDI